VTDVKLVHKKDGTFRRFGFIGYKTPNDAKKAADWFNGTYFGSCKIQVETVEEGLKADRPAKRPRTEKMSNSSTKMKETKKDKPTDDSLLKEYLEVMRKSKKNTPIWSDPVSMMGVPEVTHNDNVTKVAEEVEASKEPASDTDWLKSKMKSIDGLEDKAFFQDEGREIEQVEPGSEGKPEVVDAQVPETNDAAQSVLATARLFLRNLTFSVTHNELEELFTKFGPVEQVSAASLYSFYMGRLARKTINQ